MKKLNKKMINVVTTAALVASIAAPIAVSANSDNVVAKVPSVATDFDSTTTPVTSFIFKEKDVAFANNDTFRLTLPSGVKWKSGTGFYEVGKFLHTKAVNAAGAGEGSFEVVSVTNQDLELKMVGFDGELATDEATVEIPLFFEVDGAEGEVKLTVDPKNSTLTAGQYTIANISGGKTNATVGESKTIGDGGAIDTIRIDESTIGALYSASDLDQEVTVKLPSKFDWKAVDAANPVTITLGGGFTEVAAGVTVADNAGTAITAANGWNNATKTLTVDSAAELAAISDGSDTLKFNVKFTAKPSAPGTIYISGLKIDAESDAPYGDISVDVSGDKVTGQDIKVAEYSDYSSKVVAKSDVPTILAGRANDDADDLKLVEVEVKEGITGSWLEGRSLKIEFPTGVKVVGADVTEEKGFVGGALQTALIGDIAGDDNKIEFDIPSGVNVDGNKKSFKVKFFVTAAADFTGDVTAKFSGRAGVEGEVVLGKVVAPVTVEVQKSEVKTGIKNQAIKDIVITEATKGALLDNRQVRIELSDAEFSGKPEVEVTEGNIEIDEDSIKVDDNILTFDVDSESTKPSKIKISGVKLDLNRAIAEGDITAKIGGSALVRNAHEDAQGNDQVTWNVNAGDNTFGDKTYTAATYNLAGSVDVGEFDKNYVTKTSIATVITPADGTVSNEVKFVIDADKYTVNGVEKTADVAPFIQDGRTMLPIRFVAEAVGVTDQNIIYNANTKTVTLIKGDRIAQVQIGSKTLLVNGVSVQMDTAAAVKNGRTVLPLRFVAQALGADVQWDEATRTVTIK